MIESLTLIRSLGLAPVFEDLYFGRASGADVLYSLSYPAQFREISLEDAEPLTAGGMVPICSDDNFYHIYLCDTNIRTFVVKSLEQPTKVLRQFDHWQQFLAYKVLEVCETGPTSDELRTLAERLGFRYSAELSTLLDQMEEVAAGELAQLEEEFIRGCVD